MSREDWYRNTEWSQETQDAFWARWRRSRSDFHKAQYLKFQGCTLANQPDLRIAENGRALLHQVIREFPNETMQVGGSWDGLGHSFEKHRMLNDALIAYKRCIDVFDAYTGNVDTGADIHFAYLVATEQMWEHIDQARAYINNRIDADESNPFPLHWFRIYAAKALIEHHRGNKLSACDAAREAIGAAEIKRTGLKYHSDLGVVDLSNKKTKRVVKALLKLAK